MGKIHMKILFFEKKLPKFEFLVIMKTMIVNPIHNSFNIFPNFKALILNLFVSKKPKEKVAHLPIKSM